MMYKLRYPYEIRDIKKVPGIKNEEINIKAVVRFCEETQVGSGIYQINLQSEKIREFEISPGQFVVFQFKNKGSLSQLSQPSFVSVKDKDLMIFFIKESWQKSIRFSKMYYGKHQNISFPRGRGFFPTNGIRDYILVAENIGCAAMLPFSISLKKTMADEVKVYLGFQREKEIFGLKYWTDSGFDVRVVLNELSQYYHHYHRGDVTEFLKTSLGKKQKKTQVIACGSRPMLKEVTNVCQEFGQPYVISPGEVAGCDYGNVVFGQS